MEQVTIVGLDLAKRVFQVHGATADGGIAIRKKLSRGQVLAFFADLPPCVVAMEACATAHYWAREIGALGHNVRLVPPAYVKPFVKRQKNDAADAEAIAEAASRPTMRFVEPKSPQQQARAMVFRTRDLFVRQRTQTINALRAHLAEHGLIAPQGVSIALACRAFENSETCYRYSPVLNDENEEIADWLERLTTNKRSWGFGLCFLYLRNVQGYGWNHKRVYRIYCELALNLRIKPSKRLKRDKPEPLAVPEKPNEI